MYTLNLGHSWVAPFFPSIIRKISIPICVEKNHSLSEWFTACVEKAGLNLNSGRLCRKNLVFVQVQRHKPKLFAQVPDGALPFCPAAVTQFSGTRTDRALRLWTSTVSKSGCINRYDRASFCTVR